METNYILGFICMLLAWTTSFIFGVKTAMVENKKQGKQILLYGLLTFILIGTYMGALSCNDYRDGQIDALKGKYKYRMEINYDQHGTPKDTIYVKL